MKKVFSALAGLLLVSTTMTAAANEPITRKICVFDIAGNAGPIMQAMRDWRTDALSWGLRAELVPYTNEAIVSEDLQAGICDAGLITGIRTRNFNRFAGTVDSIGGIPDFEHMRMVMQVLAHPSSAERMATGSYTVMGVAPAGAAYVFVNDREINTLSRAAGKRVAVLEFDPTQAELVSQIGATPVLSDLTNFSNRFNNGVVDVIAAPLATYSALELYRGLSPDGGIINYPLAQITVQLVARSSRIPADIAQKSREYFFDNFDAILDVLNAEASAIDPKWFVEIPEEDKAEYEDMMQEARIDLREKGHYSPEMLTLQRRIRCRFDNTRGECTNPVE
ncbi:putative solute-binding protein [Isoalcanivorax indicus]|uniref:putative solute-binding protein n=1 Tax=Isoalcanivorax indicus TaxID=2202653 RepID=UPI000DBA5587|nr:putative solute-binding protein [Isoalcanivorax indicus]